MFCATPLGEIARTNVAHFCFQLFFLHCQFQSRKKCWETESAPLCGRKCLSCLCKGALPLLPASVPVIRPASLALWRSGSLLPCVTSPHRWRCGALRVCYHLLPPRTVGVVARCHFCYHVLPPRIAGAVARWDFVTICYRPASFALWRGATCVTPCDNVYGCRCGAVRVCYRLLPVETGLAILEVATLSFGCACFVTARQLYLYNTN